MLRFKLWLLGWKASSLSDPRGRERLTSTSYDGGASRLWPQGRPVASYGSSGVPALPLRRLSVLRPQLTVDITALRDLGGHFGLHLLLSVSVLQGYWVCPCIAEGQLFAVGCLSLGLVA